MPISACLLLGGCWFGTGVPAQASSLAASTTLTTPITAEVTAPAAPAPPRASAAAPPSLTDVPVVTDLTLGDPARKDRYAPVVLDAAVDTRSGEILGSTDLVRRLADTRILLIGEEHTDSEFHRVELRVIEALHASGREVLIGLEMFPYTAQGPLDDWTHGLLTEQGFIEKSDWYANWGHHYGYYRAIFDYARAEGIPMYGINLPGASVRTIRSKGYDALDAAARSHLPPRIDLTSAEHQRLYRAYFDPSDSLHGQVTPEQASAMYRVQVAWDAALGWNAAQALEAHGGPGAIMVALIGSGHVAYGLGAERQLAGQFPGTVKTLIPVAVRNAQFAPVRSVRASYADFVWGVPPQLREDIPVLGVSLSGSIGADPMRVIQVEPGSAAALAGVQVDDLLLKFGGTALDGRSALQRRMNDYHWGDEAPLELRRGEKTLILPVILRTDPGAEADAAPAAR